MRKLLYITTVLLAAMSITTRAAQPIRVRGEVTSVSGNALHVTTYSGRPVDLQLTPKTRYVWVVPARLSDIRSKDFVGIGTTGPEGHLVALEVVIFPESMRGTGEGHYPWSVPAAVAAADRHQAVTANSKAPPVQGAMTNGTVASISTTTAAPPVQGTMTNGTVASTGTSSPAGQVLAIGYGKAGKVQIFVPADAPVVRLQPAQSVTLKSGDKVFSVATTSAGAPPSAIIVAVGQAGTMPPM
jgi:hypothetical protein